METILQIKITKVDKENYHSDMACNNPEASASVVASALRALATNIEKAMFEVAKGELYVDPDQCTELKPGAASKIEKITELITFSDISKVLP